LQIKVQGLQFLTNIIICPGIEILIEKELFTYMALEQMSLHSMTFFFKKNKLTCMALKRNFRASMAFVVTLAKFPFHMHFH
jgi:hypothetical protein